MRQAAGVALSFGIFFFGVLFWPVFQDFASSVATLPAISGVEGWEGFVNATVLLYWIAIIALIGLVLYFAWRREGMG